MTIKEWLATVKTANPEDTDKMMEMMPIGSTQRISNMARPAFNELLNKIPAQYRDKLLMKYDPTRSLTNAADKDITSNVIRSNPEDLEYMNTILRKVKK